MAQKRFLLGSQQVAAALSFFLEKRPYCAPPRGESHGAHRDRRRGPRPWCVPHCMRSVKRLGVCTLPICFFNRSFELDMFCPS